MARKRIKRTSKKIIASEHAKKDTRIKSSDEDKETLEDNKKAMKEVIDNVANFKKKKSPKRFKFD